MALTVCYITRNHAPILGESIQSVREIPARVLVVDTGSTDATIRVARENGAEVREFDWDDDFSTASNFALDEAGDGWVLWMNPDEILQPASLNRVREAMKRADLFAGQVRVQQQLRPDQANYGTADLQIRLYRNLPQVRYKNRLHPAFDPPLQILATQTGLLIAPIDAIITRRAYLSQPTPDKIRWVVRLLEAELRDRPGQLPFMIELGRNLLMLNDPRGHEVLAEAAQQVMTHLNRPTAPSIAVTSLLEYLLTVSPEQNRGPINRDMARQIAGSWFPKSPPLLWVMAGERYKAHDFRTAANLLRRLLAMGASEDYDATPAFEPSIIGRDARFNLGLCHVQLLEWKAARECFEPLRSDERYQKRINDLLLDIDRLEAQGVGPG